MTQSVIEVSKDSGNPTGLWEHLQGSTRCDEITDPLPLDTPVLADHVRVVCISDTHNQLGRMLDTIPPGDLLIHAGDFTMDGRLSEVQQFCADLKQLPHRHKVVIAGNHDICLDETAASKGYCSRVFRSDKKDARATQISQAAKQALRESCTYLQDSGCTLYGYNIWGSPWTPIYVIDNWAFQRERGEPMLQIWDGIPQDTDILLTHGPPLGYGDLTHRGLRAGCVELFNTVRRRVRPRYHVFGHIHEAYGTFTDGRTIYMNAANCSLGWRLKHPPIIFDLPLPEGQTK